MGPGSAAPPAGEGEGQAIFQPARRPKLAIHMIHATGRCANYCSLTYQL